jgi:hypothetical protein
MEGYARIWITGPEGSSRTKFSYLLRLPDKGSIEVSNFLGQSLYRILVIKDEAYLIVPSKRVYWRGDDAEIIERLLGFPLDLQEMISLISGEWDRGTRGAGGWSWELERDSGDRITAGRRDGLSFTVEAFIPGTRFPGELRFRHPGRSGRLRILKMDFNRPIPAGALAREFLATFAAKTWDEIMEILDHAD